MPVSARWIERRERPGQAWAINYLGVCVEGVAGSEGAGRERQESEKKKYGDAAPAQGASEQAGGERSRSVSVCVSQPGLDTTTGSRALPACTSPGKGRSVCAWGGGYPERDVCPCVQSVTAVRACDCVDSLCVCACVPNVHQQEEALWVFPSTCGCLPMDCVD